ncbi:MAG: hypothetical protein ACOX28_01445 [Bacilli bacterium]|jgi:hypothetical protein
MIDRIRAKQAKNMAITSLILYLLFVIIAILSIFFYLINKDAIEHEANNSSFASLLVALLTHGFISTLFFLVNSIIFILYVVFYIITIVRSDSFPKKTSQILLIVGIFIPLVNIAGLITTISVGSKLTKKPKQNYIQN